MSYYIMYPATIAETECNVVNTHNLYSDTKLAESINVTSSRQQFFEAKYFNPTAAINERSTFITTEQVKNYVTNTNYANGMTKL